MTVFDSCKAISARDAADRAGLQLRAKGNKHWTNCFLHGDKTASLAIYEDGGWYCFSCHAGGDAVKLYELLYNLTPTDAAQKLADDFNLSTNHQSSITPRPHRAITARELKKAIEDIKWRRISQLLDMKHKAQARISDLGDQPSNHDKVFAEVAKSSAAQDLIDRIDSMTDDDLLAWIKKGGTLNDL